MNNRETTSTIAVLGAGSWGTALALYLARQQFPVRLWAHDPAHVAIMAAARNNARYLDAPFPPSLQPVANLADAVSNVSLILIAVPSAAFRELTAKLRPLVSPTIGILWATKGLDPLTDQLLHHVAIHFFGAHWPLAILSGPSFAKEVAAGLPTAVVIASHQPAFLKQLISQFNSNRFRTYSSADMVGVETGGVVKNVLAIATGIADGMALGANARSALITRGLAEMTRLGIALGGRAETFTGLAGIGDLVLTATDDQSRNRRFGLAIGKGLPPDQAEKNIGQVIEGRRNAAQVVELAHQHQIEMPISEAVKDILQGRTTPADAMQSLLAREPKRER